MCYLAALPNIVFGYHLATAPNNNIIWLKLPFSFTIPFSCAVSSRWWETRTVRITDIFFALSFEYQAHGQKSPPNRYTCYLFLPLICRDLLVPKVLLDSYAFYSKNLCGVEMIQESNVSTYSDKTSIRFTVLKPPKTLKKLGHFHVVMYLGPAKPEQIPL